MKEQNQKSENLISLIASAIRKNAELPVSVQFLVEKFQLIADELIKMKQHARNVTDMLNRHSEILKNVVEVQEYILNDMNVSRKSDVDIAKIGRDKLNKLN